MRQLVDGLEHHNHHDGGAVGVGDDVAGTVERVLGVPLRHHEGHILIHAESAGVVDHHSTILGDGLSKLQAGAATSRCQGDVHVLKVVVVLQEFHLVLFTTEVVFRSGASA